MNFNNIQYTLNLLIYFFIILLHLILTILNVEFPFPIYVFLALYR